MTYVLDSKITSDVVTLAEVKEWLKVDSADDDVLIQALIDSAVTTAEKLMNRDILTGTWINYRQSFDEDLTLRRGAFQSVTSIETLQEDIYVVLDAAEYTVSIGGSFGVICQIETIPTFDHPDCNAIKITFKTGFGDDESFVPEDIKAAIKLMVSNWYENRGDCADDCSGQAIPMAASLILRNYRLIDLPISGC